MRESEAWRRAADISTARMTGLCYGISRLVREGTLSEEMAWQMGRRIIAHGQAVRGYGYRIEEDYIWPPGDPARLEWAEEQAEKAEREEARDAASTVPGLSGRDEGAGESGELPVVSVPELRQRDVRGSGSGREAAGAGGDAAGAAGGGRMDKNVAERPMRKYRVKGTYVVNYEVTVPAAGIYDAEEQAERAVQDGDDEERERDKIHVDEIEEVDGEVYCPNCDQLLRLEE